MPLVLIHAPDQLPKTVFLSEGMARLGRGPDQDLRIDDPSVAMAHGELVILQQRVFIRGLSSGEEIWLDGKRVIGSTRIHEGQILRLGKVELRLKPECGDPDLEPATAVTRQPRSVSTGIPVARSTCPEPLEPTRARENQPTTSSPLWPRILLLFWAAVFSVLVVKLIADRLLSSP